MAAVADRAGVPGPQRAAVPQAANRWALLSRFSSSNDCLPDVSGNRSIVDYVYNPAGGDCITLAIARKANGVAIAAI
jgi:hypothetical protein